MTFQEYLEGLRKSPRTIKYYIDLVGKLEKWCCLTQIKLEDIKYEQLIKYIGYLKPNNQPDTINTNLAAIKHYFNYLIEEDRVSENIVEGLKIRGSTKRVLQNVLDSDELEDLYYSYEIDQTKKSNFYIEAISKRNKVIVGLLVYQGLVSNNFNRLKVEDVNLLRGTVYVVSTLRNAPRKIQLKPWQIMELKEYIDDVLPIIQKQLQINDNRLFPLNTSQFKVVLNPIIKQLKQYNQKVVNNSHIRASVIVNWLKQYNIREVQEMAGHRHIFSTESYKQEDLENLQKVINNFHPLS